MHSLVYHRGRTHTASAAKCVCNFTLTSEGGLDLNVTSITVLFITDGHSNDPVRNVCSDIQCLHNRFGVIT